MQPVTQHKYQLDGSNREQKVKINCPHCGAKRSFTRYKDYETGCYLDDSVGMCDRVNKCGVHFKPKEFFTQNPYKKPLFDEKLITLKIQKPIVHLSSHILKATLNNYENNSFIKPLLNYFSKEQIEKAIAEYYLGTIDAGFKAQSSDNLPAVFWFIDRSKNIRAGQVKLFDETCKTAKYINSEGEKKPYQTWIHSLIKKEFQARLEEAPEWLKDYIESEKVTCFWGEHLLSKYPNKPVALVEAPKTAFIASMRYNQFVWLATSSLTYLTKERCKVLRGKRVVLFPDCGIPNPKTGKTCSNLWQERIESFKDIADFKFSTLLEDHSTIAEKEVGFDLADLILKQLSKASLQISSSDIAQIPIDTRTGKDFGNLILATVWMKNGKVYDILYSKEGELITVHEKIEPISKFFNKSFVPAKLDGIDCLINIVNN